MAGSAYLWENGKVNDVAAYATNQVPDAAAGAGTLIAGDFTQALLGPKGQLSPALDKTNVIFGVGISHSF